MPSPIRCVLYGGPFDGAIVYSSMHVRSLLLWTPFSVARYGYVGGIIPAERPTCPYLFERSEKALADEVAGDVEDFWYAHADVGTTQSAMVGMRSE